MTDADVIPYGNQTVLVIDDEQPILGLIRSFLDARGLSCLTTTDPEEALEILERRPVDLVITDIHMEGISGVDVLERAREIDPEMLVILMTGQPTIDSAVRSVKANAYDYITKPFDLEEFINVVDRALEKQRLARENAALKDTLMLYQLSQAVTASVDEREVIAMVIESVAKELDADRVAIFVQGEEERLKRWGDDVEESEGLASVEREIARAVEKRGQSLILPGEGDVGRRMLGDRARTAAAIPLRGREGILGVVVALREKGPRTFTTAHLKAMTILAGNAATVMENARQTRRVIESRAGLVEANAATIGALVSALDAREHETQIHSIRVTEYALRLAREIDYPSSEMVDLKFGAMLHDIGKIGISDRILLKPGPLTEQEWKEMQRHTVIGHRILNEIHFLEQASEIVLYHHERWDGDGYPSGLAGEEIPLGARLFAVVDTLDAMTSDRPYRDALEFDDVVEELKRCSGSQFDSAIVEAFLRIPREKWERIAEEAKESGFLWEHLSLRGGFSSREPLRSG